MDSETDSGCVVGTPSSTFTIDSDDEGEASDYYEKRYEGLQNPIYPRPTPAWQLPITRFFSGSPPVGRHRYRPQAEAEDVPDEPGTEKHYPEQGPSEEMVMEFDDSWIGALGTLSVGGAAAGAAEDKQQKELKKQIPKKRSSDEDEPPTKKMKKED